MPYPMDEYNPFWHFQCQSLCNVLSCRHCKLYVRLRIYYNKLCSLTNAIREGYECLQVGHHADVIIQLAYQSRVSGPVLPLRSITRGDRLLSLIEQ